MDPRGTVGSIYKGEYYTLVHTTYENSGPYGFGEEGFFLCFSNCKSMGAIDPRGEAISDPRGMLGRIYVKLHITMLHTKYRSFGCCGFREEDFSCIFHCKPMADNDAPRAGPVWTPGPWLAGFIKRTTIHCYTQNMKALGLVVSEKKIFFMFFP